MARFLAQGPVSAPALAPVPAPVPARMVALLRTLLSITGSLFLLALTVLTAGLALLLAGCASQDVAAPSPELVKAQRDSFHRHTRPHTFSESPEPYLKGRLVGLRTDPKDHPLLRTRVTLTQRGSLQEVAASLARLAPVTALVTSEDSDSLPALSSLPRPMSPSAGAQIPGLEDLVPAHLDLDFGLASGSILDVNYAGTLRGLLDTIAGLSGYGWDFDARTRRITFSRLQVRTFVLAASVGTVAWDSQVSNRSREQQGNALSGDNINATVTSGDTTSQTAQINTTKATLDVWKDVETTVKGLLSRAGTVSINQSAGTLTVRDTHSRLEAIARYIEEMNARLERQVALCVRVWALEVSDASRLGLNLQTLFTSPDVAVEAGTASQATGSLAAVSVLKGRLTGSSATLEALKEWGNATQLTSASGLVMNNQPFPVQAVRRHAYLAGMTMSTSEYSQTSEITPGEVTTGFAMTLIPHILPDRHVLLQYNITLSSLEDMTTIERDSIAVQLPQVSTRAFSQRTRLKAGQTLVLAGFEQDTASATRDLGLLSGLRDHDASKTLLVISIELEGADNV